ncbi:MAG: peptidoglycan-binding domain-containing protein [Hyphomicrobiaceae bacterium]
MSETTTCCRSFSAIGCPGQRLSPSAGAVQVSSRGLAIVLQMCDARTRKTSLRVRRAQRRGIQRQLKALGLYNGTLDGVFGDLTRQAIKDFQEKLGAETTGYLTPDQFKQLVASR